MEITATNNEGKNYDLYMSWSITQTCNFHCYQCAGKARPLKGENAPEEISIDKLMNTINNLQKTIRVGFSGGEPLLIKNCIEIFEAITKDNYIDLTSNLVNPKVKDFAERINPARVCIVTASAHINELERTKQLDKFIDNCLLLKNKGFHVFVAEVAYPYLANRAESIRELFSSRELVFEFMAFRGTWKGKKYPDAYSADEKKAFNINQHPITTLSNYNRKNKLCHAGYNIFVSDNNGNIHPCFSLNKNIGHLYHGIKLFDKLIHCPYDFCPCPFPVIENYLLQKALIDQTL